MRLVIAFSALWILCGVIGFHIVRQGYRRRYSDLWTTEQKHKTWLLSLLLGPAGMISAWAVYGRYGDRR